MAGFRRKDFREYKDNIFMQKGVGNWEMHTKGVGSKLLLKVCLYPILFVFFKCLLIKEN